MSWLDRFLCKIKFHDWMYHPMCSRVRECRRCGKWQREVRGFEFYGNRTQEWVDIENIWVVYAELGEDKPVRITVGEAIRRAKMVYNYPTDEQALHDFMTIHWAWMEGE